MKNCFVINIKKPIQKGQSMVEMAITLTLIITLLSGAFDFGTAFFYYISLRDAAQEGAIYGSIEPIIDTNGNGQYDLGEPLNTTLIVTRVRFSPAPLNLANEARVTVNVTLSDPPCTGGWVQVDVLYNYQISMPFLSAILGSNEIPLHASMINTILTPACPPSP